MTPENEDTSIQNPAEEAAEVTTSVDEAPAITDEDHPSEDAPYIVIHSNEHGHHFATRVFAKDDSDAEAQVLAAHEDNTIEDSLPDDGREEHGYGGSILTVTDLDLEP